jgi:hypothetical protein
VVAEKPVAKEPRKLRELEAKIETLEKRKADLEAEIGSGSLIEDALVEASNRYGEVVKELDAAMEAWVEAQG